jgi:hypothetical protein
MRDPLEQEAEQISRDMAEDPDYVTAQGDGSPRADDETLSPALTTFFEERLGADARDVRLHAGAGGAEAARGTVSDAFTVGSDVSFDIGKLRWDAVGVQRVAEPSR